MDVSQYFSKPFDGTEVLNYMKIIEFNDFPPMVLNLELSNIFIHLISDFSKKE